ncbi:MAG: 2-C-methyl-D-erythritol 4-phosphate cytidylyltransferase [Planctomycetota bacterium]|nr:2-C-methyl-D-erythritol 4-phosphate cytidylyltransferase [Planctomycetaceae bacterium]MDQ3331300.1 2-C-methyl-D-erythritol 4-phosphate cytidylyltransferase [Planctomycetota bacterium]
MPRFAVILPAAGKSSRFVHQRRKKPFAELKGRAVWLRSVDLFVNRDDVVQTLLCLAPDDIDWFKETFRADLAFRNVEIVEGGAERADSVEKALAQVRDDADFVAVHDAARPLLVDAWITAVFDAAAKSGAAIPAVRTASTVKRVKGNTIVETVPREELWQAQTPQVVRTDLLREAFAKRDGFIATDEAQLVERIGHPVQVVEGSPMNFKITTSDDFKMAEAVLDALPKPRTLRALHPFADEEPGGFR